MLVISANAKKSNFTQHNASIYMPYLGIRGSCSIQSECLLVQFTAKVYISGEMHEENTNITVTPLQGSTIYLPILLIEGMYGNNTSMCNPTNSNNNLAAGKCL